MSDKMRPIPFTQMLEWIFKEYELKQSIFEIPSVKFFKNDNTPRTKIFNEELDLPIGPAAGPHTQLAQNIVSSYLVGGRFFELKTVQKLDKLEIKKPCIDMLDEGYNTEWSQELTLEESYDEYLKAWFIIHMVKQVFGLSSIDGKGFIFNMSVGYDLEGIKTERMDQFINDLKNATDHILFNQYKDDLLNFVKQNSKTLFSEELGNSLNNISADISNSVTLSTMHGCPPDEIERIVSYLVTEKNLHTYVKLNPTLLGYNFVNETLNTLGYDYIELNPESFKNDLQFSDAAAMLKRLKILAKEKDKSFGIKLSNTLGVANNKNLLPDKEMYMSGRSLFPLTINLAYKLASEFNGELDISFSGGAVAANIKEILNTGIQPVTMVTDLLKPGGYYRLKQIADITSEIDHISESINLGTLRELAEISLDDIDYRKKKREVESIKVPVRLTNFDCYIAPCRQACPIHQDVAGYIKLVEEKKYVEALELIYSQNPLPHITGYICDHQCQFHCTRWDYDEPVLIRELKKEAALKGYDDYIKKFESYNLPELKDTRAAIIGAGPSGLSAAYFLAKAGIDVTVFEKEKSAGGIVNNVLPKFRLPQNAIDKDIELIKKLGVKFKFGVNEKFSIDSLKNSGFDYIYISIGAEKPNTIKLEGEDEKILNALEFLRKFRDNEKIELGKNVAVIGGGNSAMDGARAAKRIDGVENIFIIYRRTKKFMPADLEEFDEALSEGVIFRELLSPVKFNDGNLTVQKMQLSEFGSDGRRKVIHLENEYETLQIDTVISAIGEQVDFNILQKNNLLNEGDSKVHTNEVTNETNIENVFIGGDALRGPSTVVEAIADGRKAADAILEKEKINGKLLQQSEYQINRNESDLNKIKGLTIPVQQDNLTAESARCLHCDFICNKCVEVCPNRANVLIDSKLLSNQYKDIYQVLHIDGLCNECGNCETFCPYEGSPYFDKPTLFWSDDDFSNSRNDGFILVSSSEIISFNIRYKSQVGTISYDENGSVSSSSFKELSSSDEFISFIKFIFEVYNNYSYLFVKI
jgi:putative selenate reductase